MILKPVLSKLGIFLLVINVCVINGFSFQTINTDSSIEADIEIAKDFYFSESYSEAINFLDELIRTLVKTKDINISKRDEFIARAYFWAGRCFEKMKYDTLAISMYKKTLKLIPYFNSKKETWPEKETQLFLELKRQEIKDYGKKKGYTEVAGKVINKPKEESKRFKKVEKRTTEMMSVGSGMGYYYGGMGLNLEYFIYDYIGVFGGLGLARAKGGHYFVKGEKGRIGYAIGVRVYPLRKKNAYRPRAGVYYGYNGIFKGRIGFLDYLSTHKNITTGLGVSIGSDFKITEELAIDFDIILPLTKKGEMFIKHNDKVSNLNLEKDSFFYHISFVIRFCLQKKK